jgi:hypothetical protein
MAWHQCAAARDFVFAEQSLFTLHGVVWWHLGGDGVSACQEDSSWLYSDWSALLMAVTPCTLLLAAAAAAAGW